MLAFVAALYLDRELILYFLPRSSSPTSHISQCKCCTSSHLGKSTFFPGSRLFAAFLTLEHSFSPQQGAVQQFMSKWMDATMHTAVFHLQSKCYDGARPPSFFDHDELNKLNLTRERSRRREMSHSSTRILKSVYDCKKELLRDDLDRTTLVNEGSGTRSAMFNYVRSSTLSANDSISNSGRIIRRAAGFSHFTGDASPESPLPSSLPIGVLNGRWDALPTPTGQASSTTQLRTALNATYFPAAQRLNRNFAYRPSGKTPPLFLQELAHLSSLLCAVALSTLRNDIEDMESPLDVYVPGAPWPVADPDQLPQNIRLEFQHRYHIFTIIRYWLGNDRLPSNRNRHNASRPL